MAATHAAQTSIAIGTSNAAAATKTGTVVDLTACYGAIVTAQIVNGGTGPTIAATVNVYVSNDNTNFRLFATNTAGVTASATYPFSYVLPMQTMYCRVDVTGNTAQAVTCEALLQTLTGI